MPDAECVKYDCGGNFSVCSTMCEHNNSQFFVDDGKQTYIQKRTPYDKQEHTITYYKIIQEITYDVFMCGNWKLLHDEIGSKT